MARNDQKPNSGGKKSLGSAGRKQNDSSELRSAYQALRLGVELIRHIDHDELAGVLELIERTVERCIEAIDRVLSDGK
jgi:hypothetical protein